MNVAQRQDIIDEQGKVESLFDFFCWVKQWTKARLKNQTFILEVQQAIGWIDPIEYLHELYYTQEKSLDEIIITLGPLSIKVLPKATLHRLLFIHFWWEPRENTKRTPVHEKKLSSRIERWLNIFNSQVDWLLKWKAVNRVFKMKELQEKTYRIQKALYILNTLWGIDKKVLLKLSREWWLSDAIIARALNKNLQSILWENQDLGIKFSEVELYPQSINRWFRYNSEKS